MQVEKYILFLFPKGTEFLKSCREDLKCFLLVDQIPWVQISRCLLDGYSFFYTVILEQLRKKVITNYITSVNKQVIFEKGAGVKPPVCNLPLYLFSLLMVGNPQVTVEENRDCCVIFVFL